LQEATLVHDTKHSQPRLVHWPGQLRDPLVKRTMPALQEDRMITHTLELLIKQNKAPMMLDPLI
jgi:hypothetical protein